MRRAHWYHDNRAVSGEKENLCSRKGDSILESTRRSQHLEKKCLFTLDEGPVETYPSPGAWWLLLPFTARTMLETFFGDEKMARTENRGHLASMGVRVLAGLALVAFLASGCSSGGSVMMQTERISAPEQGKSLVTFMRPSGFGGAITFGCGTARTS